MKYKWNVILQNGKYALLQSTGDTQYAVVSGYDSDKPDGSQWDHGEYFCYWSSGNAEKKTECLQKALDYFRSKTEKNYINADQKYMEVYREEFSDEDTYLDLLDCVGLNLEDAPEYFGVHCIVDQNSLKSKKIENM